MGNLKIKLKPVNDNPYKSQGGGKTEEKRHASVINSAREPSASASFRVLVQEPVDVQNQTQQSVLKDLRLKIQNLTKENDEQKSYIASL